MRNGWVDYIAPQLYWHIGFPVADYAVLARWWAAQAAGTDTQLWIGQSASRPGAPGRPAWELVKELTAGLDLPVTLRAVGMKRESLDELALRALDYQAVKANPRPVATAGDVREILELAW